MEIFKNKFVFILLISQFVFSQQLDFDFYSGEKKESNNISFKFIQQGIVNINSFSNISASIEAFKLSYKSINNFNSYLTLFSTRTFFSGKKDDKLNTLSTVLNPFGGTLNINIHSLIPIKVKEDFNSSLGVKIGKKLVEARAIYLPLNNRAFFENYFNLGSLIQKKIIDDPLNNTSLFFWSYINFFLTKSSKKNREIFFDNKLKPLSNGYGFEIGLQYNRSMKILLIGNKILNTEKKSKLNKMIFQLSISYRFLK